MVFTYHSQELCDPKLGCWVVVYSAFVASVESFLVVDVYDRHRLWCLSAETIRNILRLELVQLLGSRPNAEELERLLRVIERRNFASLPDDW